MPESGSRDLSEMHGGYIRITILGIGQRDSWLKNVTLAEHVASVQGALQKEKPVPIDDPKNSPWKVVCYDFGIPELTVKPLTN